MKENKRKTEFLSQKYRKKIITEAERWKGFNNIKMRCRQKDQNGKEDSFQPIAKFQISNVFDTYAEPTDFINYELNQT